MGVSSPTFRKKRGGEKRSAFLLLLIFKYSLAQNNHYAKWCILEEWHLLPSSKTAPRPGGEANTYNS